MAERVTVEHNGEMITLEVPDGTTDEEITSFLTGQSSTKQEATGGDVAKQALQAIAPSMITQGATGLGQLAGDVAAAAKPIMDVGRGVVQSYKANPAGMVADAVLLHGGVPPVFGGVKTAEGLYDTYKAAKEVGGNVSNMLSRLPESARDNFMKVVGQLKPDDAARLMEQGPKGLKSFELPSYVGPKGAEAFAQVQSQVPSTMQKVGSVAGPIARGAGKVLGPAGMAMNVYDAGQMARETELGSRLAQGQGQSAEQAFRNLNTKYANAMTPVEAQNVLASGSQRDIEAFGGQDRLKQLIRQKAAQRVLGQ